MVQSRAVLTHLVLVHTRASAAELVSVELVARETIEHGHLLQSIVSDAIRIEGGAYPDPGAR